MNHATEATRYRALASQELELGRLRSNLPTSDDDELAPLSPFAIAAHYSRRARVHDTLARARVQGSELEGNTMRWLEEATRLALGGAPWLQSESECLAYAEACAADAARLRVPT